MATPPHFRPIHFDAAVEAKKHCFIEKPVAVDAPGVRQVLAPEASRGRVMATLRFFEWGGMPIGSVVGGLVGEASGPAAALAVAALVFMFASVWIVSSPLRSMKVLPAVA